MPINEYSILIISRESINRIDAFLRERTGGK